MTNRLKNENNTFNCSHHCPVFNILAPQQCGFAPSCSLFEEMCVFPTNKTCDPPKGATYKYQISGYRNMELICCQISQYLEGYPVLNVGKLGSYISFLVKAAPALSFIVSIAEAGAYIR